MTTARTVIALAVLALALGASAGPSEAASDQPGRQLRAAIHDFFTPPRRSKRAKAKQERAAKPDQADRAKPKQERAAKPAQTDGQAKAASAREKAIAVATDASVAAREAKPAAKASRPTQAKDRGRTEREAQLPAAKDSAPAAKDAAPAAKDTGPPAARQTAPAPKEALPAKPHGRPAKTAALPPATEAAKDAKPDVEEPETPPAPSACQLRLTDELAVLQVLAPIKTEQCAVDDVVRLDAVVAKDGRRVAMSPPATLRCTMAEAVVHWVRDELAPAVPEFGAPLKAVSIDTSFECRSRNRIKGAKLSEHGNANAIDVRTITLANGKSFDLTNSAVDKALRERVKQGACARFTTVLGPGSDGYHENHIHLDFIQRRGGYRMCQWDVRDIADVRPMPRERPPEAPPRTASTDKPSDAGADKPKARN
jgi:hypothetical protein